MCPNFYDSNNSDGIYGCLKVKNTFSWSPCSFMSHYCQTSSLHCTLGEIHFSLHSPDEKNTELKKILTKIHLFPLDYFYSNIGTKL